MMRAGQNTANVVGAYINFVGRHEFGIYVQGVRQRDKLGQAACLLAEGCRLIAMTNNDHGAQARFKAARALIAVEAHPSQTGPRADTARMLALTASAIARRHNKAEGVRDVQQRLSRHIAAQLAIDLASFDNTPKPPTRLGGGQGEILGRIAEQTGLGLLARMGGDGLLALPALPHHEHTTHYAPTKQSGHFDMTLTVVGASYLTDGYATRKLQAKSRCQNLCSGRGTGADRSHYSQDIAIVSGCCDLGIKPIETDEGHIYDFTVSEALVAEAANPELAEGVSPLLDVLGEQLARNVMIDPARMGSVALAA